MKITPQLSLNLSVIAGFALIVLLMISLTLVGLLRIAEINRHLETIVTNNNVKTALVHTMKDALRERTIITHLVSLLKDPFEQNEEYLNFNDQGVIFTTARTALEGMPQSPEEMAVQDRLKALTVKTQPFVVQAVGLAMSGETVAARKIIESEIVSAQKSIAVELNTLLDLQKVETGNAVTQANNAYESTRWLMLILGGTAAGLGLGIAFVVIRNANKQADSLQHQAMFDSLTNLPNRVLFADRLQQTALIARREKRPFGLFAMDLDRFKEINDTLGHHIGDQVLQHVAACARGCLRDSDTVARMGGDEFTILLATVSGVEGAVAVANKILKAIGEPTQIDGRNLEVSASIGVVMFPQHGDDPEVLLRQADAAMYAAKQAQSGYRVYSDDLGHGADDRMALQGELRQAIANNELVLHYQPKIDFNAAQVSGVEALVRWQHPVHGLMAPDKFISLAEQTGLIKPLTKWVLKTALRQYEEWYRTGLILSMSINVSAISIQDPEFPDQMASMLEDFDVPISQIELEITETAVMSEPVRAVECIRKLSALGFQVAIDDFGTGYSSMAYLKELLVAKIKIDKSFVKDMATNHNDAVIVRSTVELGHNLGLKVVAEGVEDQAAWDKLKLLGCDSAQGYYMSRPLPSVEFLGWLEKSPWGIPKKILS
jgi:diguanylate cyclase (GGDEF)-like protein